MRHGSRTSDRVLINAAEAMVFVRNPPVGLQPEQASWMGHTREEQNCAPSCIVAGSANGRIVITSLAVDAWGRIERRYNARLLRQGAGSLVQPGSAGLRQSAGDCRRRSFNDRVSGNGHVFNETAAIGQRNRRCTLDPVHAENQSILLGNRAGYAGRGDLRYCARETALVPDLEVGGAESVIANDAVAVAPIEPASVSMGGDELVRDQTLLALQFAEFQHGLAGRHRVEAHVGVLNAVEEA